jgi:uncharacterized metal-binding protein YceD (DUF177 family)
MADQLQDRQSLTGLAANSQVIEFNEEVEKFDRLAGSVQNDLSAQEGGEIPPDWRARAVTGRLSFSLLGDARPSVVLDAVGRTTVPAVCQRCLTVFDLPLAIRHRLVLGTDEDASEAPAEYEFWEVQGDTVRPVDIIDEALVMALPLSARHDNADDCIVVESTSDADEKVTPFAALRSLMDEREQN